MRGNQVPNLRINEEDTARARGFGGKTKVLDATDREQSALFAFHQGLRKTS